jgi:DNA-binding NarL/FixJ family response regulator
MTDIAPEAEQEAATRILLVDDHRVLLDSLAAAIGAQPDLAVVGMAATVEEALDIGRKARPDIVLLDLRLEGDDTIASVPQFAALSSRPKVVLLSAAHDRRHAARAIEAGASGYLTKQQPLHELLAGIRAVARGQAAMDPSLLSGVLTHLSQSDPTRLTRKELEVLHLLAQGLDAPKIGAQLYIAANTVRNHVQRILTKLGASSRLEAVAIARRDGLLDQD